MFYCCCKQRATIIEKHFTLNKKLKGPDHKASMDFKELKDLMLK